MSKLIYTAITSLDGYTTDPQGDIEWSAPDTEVLMCINDLERVIGTYLYGRRVYEAMLYWETFDASDDQLPALLDFTSIWRAADKVVYSRTLAAPSSARTRIERDFEPGAILRTKEASDHDISIGGADLAGQAMVAGLVDEVHLFVSPTIVGGGKPALPDDFRAGLELLRVDQFASGFVHLHYRMGE